MNESEIADARARVDRDLDSLAIHVERRTMQDPWLVSLLGWVETWHWVSVDGAVKLTPGQHGRCKALAAAEIAARGGRFEPPGSRIAWCSDGRTIQCHIR
jgi:hypothetical protein